jgi:hypothetical protein
MIKAAQSALVNRLKPIALGQAECHLGPNQDQRLSTVQRGPCFCGNRTIEASLGAWRPFVLLDGLARAR